jgi:Ca2+-binding RTX toxin-like protein
MAVVLDLQDSSQNTAEAAGDQIFGIEHIIGSGFADALAGNAEDNRIDGSVGNDTISGRDGRDVLLGGLGDDWLYGGLGADRLDGGAGFDTVVYDTASDVLVDLVTPFQGSKR